MEKWGTELPKFSSPDEEIAFLRAELRTREEQVAKAPETATELNTPARELISSYQEPTPNQVLTEDYALKTPEVAAIVLDLAPEAHDRQMEELLGILEAKGVKNALAVLAELNNPHLEDDFHRFLIQYLRVARPDQLPETEPLASALKMTLFEVGLPEVKESSESEAGQNKVKTIISLMEQLYAGLQGLPFSVELSVSNEGQETLFYISVPESKRSVLEKQVVAFFPGARVLETKNDYNVFNAEGVTVGSVAALSNSPALSLKTYEQFDYDPLNVLINSFSKLDQLGEGAAVQLVCRSASLDYTKLYKGKLSRLEKGDKTKEVLNETSLGKELAVEVGKFFLPAKKPVKPGEKPEKVLDILTIDSIKHKLEAPILEINLRLLASAPSRPSAEALLTDLEAAFSQLEQPGSNKLVFTRPSGRSLSNLLHAFSFRLFNERELLPLNLKELSTIYHFPSATVQVTDNLRAVRAKTAPPPVDLPSNGLKLGENRHQGGSTPIYFAPEDRLRHFYTVGQTGTGKSTLLKNMAIQDIVNGEGVCFVDPHGVDILDILAAVPKERFEDVIYFDPAGERPLGLNMLDYNPKYPDQKTFVVNELLAIFNKLFDMKTVGGPIFEQYFRNSALLALDEPGANPTLLDIARILAEPEFRRAKLAKSTNPIIRQFWLEVAEKAGGEAALQNVVPYITSKFDAFLTNDIMRPILLQRHSAFDFRQLMDEKKILLVNLAKGRLGDINANLIGLIVVGKILQAALSRVDAPRDTLPPFYLYIDEFQNITTNSTATILSEARKYKLGLNLAHQFIGQIEDEIKEAVFGNVGTMAAFRVGVDDAKYLATQFAPVFEEGDLVNLDNRHAYLRLLVNGRPARPFDVETLAPLPANNDLINKLRELSGLKYGRARSDVEQEINAQYQK